MERSALERGDVLCLVAILALATVFLAPALRPGYTLLPLDLEGTIAPWHGQVTRQIQNPLLSDPFYNFYPFRHVFTASLKQGAWPLWNPHIFGGHPVASDTAAQTFYPPNALAVVFLSAARALPMLAWSHLVLTGTSMFAFLRVLSLRRHPALFGAVAWMLNANAVVWVENPHRLSTLAWLPVMFFFYELALRQCRFWPAIVAGFSYGLSILGGHTQFALGNGIMLAVYAVFRAIIRSREEQRLACRPLAMASIVGLMGVGIGAVQLLPTYQFTQVSHRGVADVTAFLRSGWPRQHLLSLWIPDFYGNPVRTPYWGDRNYAEVTVYYGAFAFPLALAAIAWTRRDGVKFFAIIQALTLPIVLGTPLTWLVAWLPWLRYFRLISLIAYIPFFGGVAAAVGIDAAITHTDPTRPMMWVPLLAALASLIGLTALVALSQRADVLARWPEVRLCLWRTGLIWLFGVVCLLLARWRPALGSALLVVLVAVDLLQWGMAFNPVNSVDILYPDNEVTTWLRQDPSLYRVLPLQTDRVIFGPNVLSVFGLYEIGEYSSLMIARYRELVKAIDDEVAISWMRPNANMLVNSNFDPLFSLLNVKYVLATHPLDEHLASVEVVREPTASEGLPLIPGERVTARFLARHPGLNRVDVEFAHTESPPGAVRFLLWRDQEGGELVADIVVEGKDLPDRGVYSFFFAPVADSAGQTFVLALEAPEVANEATVWVCQAEGRAQGQPAFTAYGTQLQLADIRQGVWIYRNPNVLPRTYVVQRAEVVSHEHPLDRLTDPDFNTWTTALLEDPLPADAAAALAEAPLRSSSTVRIMRYQQDQIDLQAEMAAPGLLVLSDAYYPGWKMTVDGRPASLLRVNYALRGAYLPSGAHDVVFRFAPVVCYIGLVVTCLTVAVGTGALMVGFVSRRST
jgi:hypothetical protein